MRPSSPGARPVNVKREPKQQEPRRSQGAREAELGSPGGLLSAAGAAPGTCHPWNGPPPERVAPGTCRPRNGPPPERAAPGTRRRVWIPSPGTPCSGTSRHSRGVWSERTPSSSRFCWTVSGAVPCSVELSGASAGVSFAPKGLGKMHKLLVTWKKTTWRHCVTQKMMKTDSEM